LFSTYQTFNLAKTKQRAKGFDQNQTHKLKSTTATQTGKLKSHPFGQHPPQKHQFKLPNKQILTQKIYDTNLLNFKTLKLYYKKPKPLKINLTSTEYEPQITTISDAGERLQDVEEGDEALVFLF